MGQTITAIILISFAVGARSELVSSTFETLKGDESHLERFSDYFNESNPSHKNQIMAAVSTKINSSLFKIRDVEKELEYQGKSITIVSCLVLNKPCIAYLTRVDDEWEIVILTMTKQGE